MEDARPMARGMMMGEGKVVAVVEVVAVVAVVEEEA